MKNKTKKLFAAFILGVLSSVSFAQNYSGNGSAIIDILEDGGLIFGVFVPRQNGMFTVAASAELARNDQVDYFFLDMESDYNPDDVATVREGIDSVPMQNRPTLLVRLPTIDDAGYEQTFQRIAEVLERGADGIVFPHIRSASMAAYVSGYMRGLGVDVWSPENPDGRIISFYMIEDPYAVADAYEIAEVGGYSILSCGIGSLSSAVGSPEQGELGCLEVLAQATRAGLPSVQLALTLELIQQRIRQGYTGVLSTLNDETADTFRRARQAAAD